MGWLAVVLIACGGDEDLEVADDPEVVADQPSAPDTEDVEPVTAPEDPDGDDGSGIPGHRPPPQAQALAACGTIALQEPGASIAFPSDEDPTWLDAGDGPVTVEFIGCSNTFEATLIYEAFHGENRRPTLEGHTMGGSLNDWAPFSFEETFWTPGPWTVVVSEDDAESGDRREYDRVTFEVG